MEKTVTQIKPDIKIVKAPVVVKKRRVAGYARVSTDKEDQENSYETQMRYYEATIKAHDDWEFAGMYSDEGISGTSTKNREGFKRMIDDALSGKIDLIVTKSVSRFARNTVDSLTAIRELKENGVEVFFEKENIWTMDSKGELLITLMSSLAQEESRSISENVTWGNRRRFAAGKASVAFSRFLGYDRGTQGEFVINEEQSEIVRWIFKMFLSGLSYHEIARRLTDKKVKTPAGKDTWSASTIRRVLSNEKYKGDALLQKTYTKNYLTKEMAVNHGEVPQYYVENHHSAIIDKETFALVQKEMEKHSKDGKGFSGSGLFASKVICGCCGGIYGRKVWHSTDKYKKFIWRCNDKYNGEEKCTTKTVTVDELKAVFVKAVNKLIKNKDSVIEDLETLYDIRTDTEAMRAEAERIYNEEGVTSVNLKSIEAEIASAEKAGEQLREFIDRVKSLNGRSVSFNETLWRYLAEGIVVRKDGKFTVRFKSGYEVVV